MLTLNGIEPIHWGIAGSSIAVLTLAFFLIPKHRLGMSTGLEGVCSLVLKAPYLQRKALLSSRSWRLQIVLGLVLGGVISAYTSGGLAPIWSLGMFDAAFGWGKAAKLAWMFAGGVLIGFGTRYAGGCTSGYGIFGNSNLEPSALLSSLSFMGAGVITTNLIYRLILG